MPDPPPPQAADDEQEPGHDAQAVALPGSVNISPVIRKLPRSSDAAWHSSLVRARHTGSSAYVWRDYAMIRRLSAVVRHVRLAGRRDGAASAVCDRYRHVGDTNSGERRTPQCALSTSGGAVMAAVLGGLVSVTAAAGEQFIPVLGVREGAARSTVIPITNGFIDYLTLLNERDGASTA